MGQQIFKHTPLYRFLEYCQERGFTSVLDCRAGGQTPPLSLFASHGFITKGVEFSKGPLELAHIFASDKGQTLNIELGDMKKLPFEDHSFDCVYSYNSVFHMMKKDIDLSIKEMKRVLKPGGLLFVNFLSTDDFRCGEGPHLGENQYEQMDDEPVIHSYYQLEEADAFFEDMTFVLKERRVIERMYEGNRIRQGFIDYIMEK